jgi:hypothetical protein
MSSPDTSPDPDSSSQTRMFLELDCTLEHLRDRLWFPTDEPITPELRAQMGQRLREILIKDHGFDGIYGITIVEKE